MENYSLNQLRKMFLEFFESKGHLMLGSFPLIPHNDKSLLLINSGMAPLKPYFTGQEEPPRKRVTTCQKCIRTPDIENVGKTARHGTFFEMLGNFSFGDYFKTEAIHWAWEFFTEVLKIDKDKLYVTVYENDDEAYEIWSKEIGLPDEKISRMGKEDNFWEIGTGPCGPCSEIYVDRGEAFGCGKPDCKVGCECDRYVEVWNLVFTQFSKDEDGNYTKLEHPNIDTGMGLERLATYSQGVNTIFEVDTIRYILDYVCELANKKYGQNDKDDVSIRVITDHIRSVVFMASDGVMTSNEGRGYVLKRLLRRAVRHGKLLGIEGFFMTKVAQRVIDISKEAYPELIEKEESILKLISVEEERFNETISQGLKLLKESADKLKKENKNKMSGEEAFKLYDTYGFPLELTEEILAEEDLMVDIDGFNAAMKKQKETARNARSDRDNDGWKDELAELVAPIEKTIFDGYENLSFEGKVLAVVKDNKLVDFLDEGNGVIIVDKTPFYAESGGQAGDKGEITGDNFKAIVNDCKKSGDKFAHYVEVSEGSIKVNDTITLSVDKENRLSSERNHSCTHLLHKALKEVLGEHVNQAGSNVDASRLRFDFSHFEKLKDEEIKLVEEKVNEAILNCLAITYKEMKIADAKAEGATALFGEKYGDVVRVVKMGDYSTELCGGCHLKNTGFAGMFKIVSQSSVAAGVRRIEAVTGKEAVKYLEDLNNSVENTAVILKATKQNLAQKAAELVENNKLLQKEIVQLKAKMNKDIVGDIINEKVIINKTDVIIKKIDGIDMTEAREIGDKIRDKLDNCVVFLIGCKENKGFMLSCATKNAVNDGFNAGAFLKKVAQSVNSGGGGRPDMAQAGLKDLTRIDEAIKNAEIFIKEML